MGADKPLQPMPEPAAREAGVSATTVSPASNGRADVPTRTRRLIAEVLERRGLPRRRGTPKGGMIDVVMPGLGAAFGTAMLEGVEEAAWQLGVELVVAAVAARIEHGRPPHVRLERLSARDSAGVLLVRTSPGATQRAWLADRGIPAVVVEPRRKVPRGLSVVAAAGMAGARAATEHLIGLGHERIAIITGHPGAPCSSERRAGYRNAMAGAGLKVDPRWEACGNFQMYDALQATRAMFDELSEHRRRSSPVRTPWRSACTGRSPSAACAFPTT